MTLRARLLLTCGVILGIVAVGSFVILSTQRTFLVTQIDDQLRAARPFVPPAVLENGRFDGQRQPFVRPGEAPISALYLGIVRDDSLLTVLRGQLLDDVPDIDTDALGSTDVPTVPFTVDSSAGDTQFRVLATQIPDSDAVSVIALPLDEVEGAIDQLRWSLLAVGATIAASLLLAMWWVQRLGLNPIASVTAAADAIAGGDRARRAVVDEGGTEAGRLATAFNVMLDERDATEERLRQFVADASHELRTPLTSMRGYLDLYRQGAFREAGQLDDIIRRMSRESARMNELVEDLLLLARLDQHRTLRREPVDISRLLEDAAADARVIQPGRTIVLDTGGDRRVLTIGDPFRLQQVVGILVNNALVHTDPTSQVRLTCTATDQGVRTTVSDDGPGIAPEVVPKVFDRFFRGDRSRNRRTGGAGLGLAIARSIVEAHDGTITLTSEPGRGSTFAVELPGHRSAVLHGSFPGGSEALHERVAQAQTHEP